MANGPEWTFLSNHAHVLLCIAKEPEMRLREVAPRVGITERAVQRIVADLEEGGYLSRSREGRRNRYEVHLDRPLRHSVESHREVGVLLNLILRPDQPDPGDPESGQVATNLSGARRAGRSGVLEAVSLGNGRYLDLEVVGQGWFGAHAI
jgi:DNA-binding transcriptional ArsR family regulator